MARGCRPALAAIALGPLLTVAAAGCARTHAKVSGRVVEDGRPYQHTGEMVQLVMTCAAPSLSVSATVQPDGTFKFYGTEGKGLPAGKYKIGIESDVESAPGVKKRIRGVAAQKSPMEIELAGGESVTLTIDLVRHTLTR
jgi:hypothetical protein